MKDVSFLFFTINQAILKSELIDEASEYILCKFRRSGVGFVSCSKTGRDNIKSKIFELWE
ncbi:hypothetical protein BZG02_02715 [Labilibaculum filiforme]|uniref:Uncharacterized protein n=1 Tax=Labilibaculum filiforme TaxID=1940526 RepID=A0A2N3I3A8_9BACT|nr:hypothetical protein BZG02_02715 [Labilibaculum filiforme]